MKTAEPPYYTIIVRFKPSGIPRYEVSETRKVRFKVKSEKSSDKYYEIAEEKAISNGIISYYGMKYWEPYKIQITCPDVPSELDRQLTRF